MILKNCLMHDFESGTDKTADIYITDRIVKYGENIVDEYSVGQNLREIKISELTDDLVNEINNRPEKFIIDVERMATIPGGIDPHVHFDTPGYTHREDFYHGSMSAAAGGITTVIDMPCTSVPPVTNGSNFDSKMNAIKNESVVDFALFGGVDAGNFAGYEKSMEELAAKGVRGFKTYFISGMKEYPRVDKEQFLKILEIGKQLGIPILLHAEDYDTITKLEEKLKNETDDYFRYYRTRPSLCEERAAEDAVNEVKKIDGDLHVVHVASGKAAALLNRAQAQYNVTYETCPHYLYYTYKDFTLKGSSLKTAPVVKDEEDKKKLWEYLTEGGCGFVSSDHAPAPLSEKNTGSFQNDYGGIPGTQTLIPLVFSEGYIKRKLSLKRFTEIVSTAAAKRYGLYPRKGVIAPGSDADITIINQNKKWIFKKQDLYSKGETSPFDGESFTGKIALTILRGKIIFSETSGITTGKGYGKYL